MFASRSLEGEWQVLRQRHTLNLAALPFVNECILQWQGNKSKGPGVPAIEWSGAEERFCGRRKTDKRLFIMQAKQFILMAFADGVQCQVAMLVPYLAQAHQSKACEHILVLLF